VSPSSPSSRRAGARALAALLCALAASRAGAAVRLEVAGDVEPAEDGLLVRVDVTNKGDRPAGRIDVEGELFGHYAESSLFAGVQPGSTQSAWLHFTAAPPRPGVHALALHLRYPVIDVHQPASQRAFLLLALGARAESPLRVSAAPARFETAGTLRVELGASDGAAHVARVRVLAPRGLNVLETREVTVPAGGTAQAEVPLIRTGASRGERLELIVLAATATGGVESTATALAQVELFPHRPLLPRLRIPLTVAGGLLLAAAVAAELWRRL
jgi:hypothetical protein